ncbi:hypothetical protein V8F06_004858 [Rhypophila decipiens]
MSSISEEDREEAQAVFGLLRFQKEIGQSGSGDLGLLGYAFLADILRDPEFAKNYQAESHSPETLQKLLEDASTRLGRCCQGLVTIRRDTHLHFERYAHLHDQIALLPNHLGFAHHAVADFLHTGDNAEFYGMLPPLDSMKTALARLAIHMLIIRAKALPFPEIKPVEVEYIEVHGEMRAIEKPSVMLDFLAALVHDLHGLFDKVQQLPPVEQKELFPELSYLDELLCLRQGMTGSSLDIDWSDYCSVRKGEWRHGKRARGLLPVVSLFQSACMHGLGDCVRWAADQHPEWCEVDDDEDNGPCIVWSN